MKLTKKLLPALGMLALSTCMMVTSTFAWFSMNTDVYAEGMTVQATGEQVYLQIINKDETFSDNASQNSTSSALATGVLKPVTVGSAFDATTGVTAFTLGDSINAGASQKWATSFTTNKDQSTTGEKYTAVADPTTGYVFKETFTIRLNPTAGLTSTASPLRVASVAVTGTGALKNAVSVFVVLGDNGQLFTQNADGTSWVPTGDKALTDSGFANTGTDMDEGVEVTVYVFFDGEHEDCTTANLWDANENSTNSYSVRVDFTVSAAS